MALAGAGGKDHRILRCGAYTYSLDDSLGSGSFADVFRGSSPQGSPVAIKRIAKSKLSKGNNHKLLQSEINILETLRHPNIVQLLDHQETPEHIFLIMEYCGSGDLATFISRKSPMGEELIADILQQLVDALAYLSAKNIVHRDLKPHNILLHARGGAVPQVKIADFGFARLLVEEDLAATFCGTPLYMAPEVLDGDTYRASADLFSLGAIVYQLYTGQPPFRAANIRALKDLHHHGAGPIIRQDASPAFRDLLLGLLQVNPEKRMSLAQLSEHPFLPFSSPAHHAQPLSPFGGEPDLPSHSLPPPRPATPPTPAPAPAPSSRVAASSQSAAMSTSPGAMVTAPGNAAAAATAGPGAPDAKTQDVDDRSYVLIDPAFVEVNILADSVERRMRVAPGTGRNPTELVSLLEQVVTSANLVVSLANECLQSQPEHLLVASVHTPSSSIQAHGEALVLFAKALGMLRSGLSNLRSLICRSTITVTPALYSAVQNLRQKFNECVTRIELIRSEMSPAHMRSVRASAEQLIYNHAVALSREAAKGEANGNYSSSEVGYSKALAFLRIILPDADGHTLVNVENIVEALTERRRAVVVRRQEQEAQRTRRQPLTTTLEETSSVVDQQDRINFGAMLNVGSPGSTFAHTAAAAMLASGSLPLVSASPSAGTMYAVSASNTLATSLSGSTATTSAFPTAASNSASVSGALPITVGGSPSNSPATAATNSSVTDNAAAGVASSSNISPLVTRHNSAPLASAPIAISGPVRHFSVRERASPHGDMSPPNSRSHDQAALLESPLPPLDPSLRTSPSLRKAAFCGHCGTPFNSESQRFCTVCGTVRSYVSPSS